MANILTRFNRLLSLNFRFKLNTINYKTHRTFVSDSISNQNLSYRSNPGETPLLGQTLGNILDRAAAVYGTKEAVVVCQSNVRKNFIQLKQDADNFAAGLLAIGLKEGDRIGIWSPNNYEWIITQYAAAKAGLILVNINPGYQPKELEYCVQKVGIRALVSAEKFKTQNYYEMLKSIFPSLPKSSPGEVLTKSQNLSHVIMISDKNYDGTFKFSNISNTFTQTHLEQLNSLQQAIQFDHPANIQFTSGTTGKPKGATLSHFNIVNNCFIVGKRLGYHEKIHRICINPPLYHTLGCGTGSVCGLLFGACQVYPSPSFNAKAAAEAVHHEKCTSMYGTPTMFIDVLNLPDLNKYDFSSLTTGLMAGSPCPVEVVKATMTKLNAREINVSYGCTETSPMITQTSLEDSPEKRAETVGKVLPHAELKLVDPITERVVPRGSTGELWARGYMVMLGYWNDEEKSRESITADKWYKTGDLAKMDKDGYVQIVGRIKDMIIRGGENIYPREIEDFLFTHPKIADVQVVGVPDVRLGEELCAWIRLKAGEKLTEEDLREFCKGKIAHFKIPRYVKFVDNFPTTVTGKIQKFKIREIATNELGLSAS